MSSLLHSSTDALDVTVSPIDLFLRQRLQVVEDLWESVIRQECGQHLVNLLEQLRDLCSPEGQATNDQASSVAKLISQLDLNEAIRAARAFALYFQLINIVEQHYEQRQQINRFHHKSAEVSIKAHQEHLHYTNGNVEVDLLEKNWQVINSDRQNQETFHTLFPHLHSMNVPPQHIQRLIDQLDVQLVFTAHPTEIVRHTIRDKQRRMAKLLQELDRVEEGKTTIDAASSWEAAELKEQLTEEIRLWWRTDELHQFKPAVLDEVEYALHYFQEVLFDEIPKLYQRDRKSVV